MRKILLNASALNCGLAYAAVAILILLPAKPVQAQTTYSATVLYPLLIPSDLQPSLATAESAISGQVVGYDFSTTGGTEHALLWSDASGQPVDLNPPGFAVSEVRGTDGTQEVGEGQTSSAVSYTHLDVYKRQG